MVNKNLRRYVESMREKAQELNRKNAPVELVPDYEGEMPSAPSLGDFPTNAGGVKQKGSVSPYKGGKDAPDPNKGFGSDGLAHKGGKGYESMPKKAHGEEPKEKASYPNIKTHEWLEKNKNLSLAEFTKRLRNERLSGLNNKPSTAYDAIKEAVIVFEQNEKYMVDAVLQMKRAGVFESFLLTMMQQPEAMSVQIGRAHV